MKFFFPLSFLAFSLLMRVSFADEAHLKGKESKSAMSAAIYAALSKPNYGGPYGNLQLGYNYNNAYNRPPTYGTYGSGLGSLYAGSLYGGGLYSKPNNNVIDLDTLVAPSYAASVGASSPYGSGAYSLLSAYNRPSSYAGSNYAVAAANAYNANTYANVANSYANAAGSYGNAASSYAVMPSYVAGYRGALKVNRMSDDADQS